MRQVLPCPISHVLCRSSVDVFQDAGRMAAVHFDNAVVDHMVIHEKRLQCRDRLFFTIIEIVGADVFVFVNDDDEISGHDVSSSELVFE